MAEEKPKVAKLEKKKKVVDPVAASIDVASQEMRRCITGDDSKSNGAGCRNDF